MTPNTFASLTIDRHACETPVPSGHVRLNTHQSARPVVAPETKTTVKRPSYRILVIEDDPHIARLILVNLSRAGLEGRSTLEGNAGLEAFREHPPHLVLLDLMMPIMDGFQVCEKIRAISSVPIIIMTARLEPIYQMRGFRLGADDYILKPFDPQLLVARVIAHLRRVYRYDNGQIKCTGAESENIATVEPKKNESQENGVGTARVEMNFDQGDSQHQDYPAEQQCFDVLAHMPLGWAGCSACNYMGPLSKFPRLFNGQDASSLACPNCRMEGHIKFAVG